MYKFITCSFRRVQSVVLCHATMTWMDYALPHDSKQLKLHAYEGTFELSLYNDAHKAD